MLEHHRLKSIDALYVRSHDPAVNQDIYHFAQDLRRGRWPGLGLDAPVIMDFTALDEPPSPISNAQRLAIQRAALQGDRPTGPLAVICRDLKDLMRVRFYGVISHLSGFRPESQFNASMHPEQALRHFAAHLDLDPAREDALVAEVLKIRSPSRVVRFESP